MNADFEPQDADSWVQILNRRMRIHEYIIKNNIREKKKKTQKRKCDCNEYYRKKIIR